MLSFEGSRWNRPPSMFEEALDSGPENTPLLPQRGKRSSVSGSALLTSSVRNHARSAFKRFSPHCPSLLYREGWRGNGVKNLKGAELFPCIVIILFVPQSFHRLGRGGFPCRKDSSQKSDDAQYEGSQKHNLERNHRMGQDIRHVPF